MKAPVQVPYCSLGLIAAALCCHVGVFFGNMYAAQSISALGQSSNGWAEIGLSLGHSIGGELDRQLSEVSRDLTDVVSSVVEMKAMLGGAMPLAELARRDSSEDGTPHSIDETVMISAFLIEKIADVLGALKPVLSQVDHWESTMGEKLQSKIETFTGTLDKAQKVFDLAMGYLDTTPTGEEAMLHDSFLLFDTSNNGRVTVGDLHRVSRMYAISAFSGSKAEDLVLRYDTDDDHALNRVEFKEFVRDESLPSVMSVVLRSYSSSLLNIAGSVGNAQLRGEVAAAVADYLHLVCTRNMTKVSWIAGALTNGSLPLAFTADVIAQLAADPDQQDTGALVVGQMVNFGPDRVASAVELMANASFWQASGFDVEDQARTVELASRWAVEGMDSPALPALMQIFGGGSSNCTAPMIDVDSELSNLLQVPNAQRPELSASVPGREAIMLQTSAARLETKAAQSDILPQMARQFAERGARHRAALLKAERALHSDSRLSPAMAHGALRRLLGDDRFPQFLSSVIVSDPDAAQVVNSGVLAQPETLQFAQWLSNNATATARALAKQCFQYTSQSSGTLDSTASRVAGMIKGMQAATAGLSTIFKAAEAGNLEGAFFNVTMALLASVEEDRQITTLSEDAVRAVARAVDAIAKVASNSSSPEAMSVQEMSGDLENRLVASPAGAPAPSLWPSNGSAMMLEGAWARVGPFMNTLQDAIPSGVIGIRFSRQEVVTTSAGLKTLFSVFKEDGPAVFERAAQGYRQFWTKYILIDFLLAFWFAFFAMWASGVFGSQAHAMHPRAAAILNREESPVPPTTFFGRLRMTCQSIAYGFLTSSDKYMLFWSVLLLTEVALLLFFVATMAISLFFGIRLLLAAGCGELYILGSRQVCQEMLLSVSEMMKTFTHVGGEPLESACRTQNLLTCDIVTSSLGWALGISLFASFLAATLSWLVLVDSAAANETIRWEISELENEDEKEESSSPYGQ